MYKQSYTKKRQTLLQQRGLFLTRPNFWERYLYWSCISYLLLPYDFYFLMLVGFIYTVSSMSAFNSLNHFKFTKWWEREFSFMRRK